MNRDVSVKPVVSPEEAREDRFRMALGFGAAMILVSALSCCCLGSALVAATDDGGQTHSRPRR